MTKAKEIKMRMPQTGRPASGRLQSCRNAFDVAVNKCCASCAFKDLTRAVSLRRCMTTGKDVSPRDCCKLWTMSEQLKMAGRTQGRVKRKEYLMYLVAEREDESLALQARLKVKIAPKSIAKIRAEFERRYGSIYLDNDDTPEFRPFGMEW